MSSTGITKSCEKSQENLSLRLKTLICYFNIIKIIRNIICRCLQTEPTNARKQREKMTPVLANRGMFLLANRDF